MGRGPLGNPALRSAFYSGTIALVPLLFANSLLAVLPGEKVLGALLLFFGFGLGGLALSSLRQMRQQPGSGRLTALALTRQWLATSGIIIGLVLGAGLLVARLAAPATLARLASALNALAGEAAYALSLVLIPVAAWFDWLLAPALPGLSAFLERLLLRWASPLSACKGCSGCWPSFLRARCHTLLMAGGSRPSSPRRSFRAGARWSGWLLALAAAAIVFWLAARRLSGLTASDADEQRESILSGRPAAGPA